jgi:bacillithiol biosynthesis cysteine-adding enzyme BshC
MPQDGVEQHILSRLPLESIPGVTQLYRDYVRGASGALDLFAHPPFSVDAARTQAALIGEREYERAETAAVLAGQNRAWGAAAEALENCAKLERRDCLAVVTGQQAGFLGGPLYTVLKALHAVLLARAYEEILARPVVPIFWLEIEDHDLAEIAGALVRDRESGLHDIALEIPAAGARPVNRIPVGDAAALAFARLAEIWPKTEFSEELFTLLVRSYTPDDSLAGGFARLITGLLSRHGLVLADPSHHFFKRRAAGIFTAEIKSSLSASPAFLAHQARIGELRYHTQVQATAEKLNLFLLDGDTKYRIARSGGHFTTGDPAEIISGEDLLAVAAGEPERFIPSVLLRPLVQDTLFPTLAYIGGPGEVAYFAQLKPAYEQFGVPMPLIVPRAGATLLGGAARRSMHAYRIEASELFQPSAELVRHIVAEHVPGDADKRFDWTRAEMRASLERLKQELDPDGGAIGQAVDGTWEKFEYHLNKLQERYLKELERRNETLVRRIESLAAMAYPRNLLQERAFTIADLLNQYGPVVIERLLESIDPLAPGHAVVEI